MPEDEAKYHLKRCVDSGLWIADASQAAATAEGTEEATAATTTATTADSAAATTANTEPKEEIGAIASPPGVTDENVD